MTFYDTLPLVGTDNVAGAYSLVASSSDNYFAGVNSFNYLQINGINFEYVMTNFTLLASSPYIYINISTFNYRARSGCGYPNSYFVSPSACMSECPTKYYMVYQPNSFICLSCAPQCQTCNDSTTCLSCVSP